MNLGSPPPHIRFPTASVCTRILIDFILSSRQVEVEQVRQNLPPDAAGCDSNAFPPARHQD